MKRKKNNSIIMFIIMISFVVQVFSYTDVTAATSIGKVRSLKVSSTSVSSITISWAKLKNAQSYKIYAYNSTKKSYVCIGATSKTSYTISKLSSGKKYYYKVRGYSYKNKKYTYDSYSNVILGVTKLTRPLNLTMSSNTTSSITLKWSKPARANGYYIYSYNSSAKSSKYIGSTTNTSYTIKSLKPCTTYRYFVKPYVTYNNKKYTGTNSYILTTSTDPGNITNFKSSSVSYQTATLKWNAVTGATLYKLYLYNKATNKYTLAASTTKTSYLLKNLTSNTYYKYRVQAIKVLNSLSYCGNFSYITFSTLKQTTTQPDNITSIITDNLAKQPVTSSATPIATATPTASSTSTSTAITTPTASDAPTVTALKAPTASISMNELNKLTIKWNKVTNAEGYLLYKYNRSTSKYELLKTLSSISYTDTDIIHSQTYKYKVRAYTTTKDADITSAYSNEASIFTGSYGIDVSKWQNNIDWKKVAASGVDFAIIRATTYSSKGLNSTHLVKDGKFDQNMKGAIAAGIKVGVYVYSYADTTAEAIAEAKLVLDFVKGYDLTYPITFDFERSTRANTSLKTENTAMITGFCNTIINAGYETNVYSGASYLLNYINYSSIKKYGIWVARYKTTQVYNFPNELTTIKSLLSTLYNSGNYSSITNATMWQYTDRGTVDGIEGQIDMNYSYINYN